MSSLVSIQLSDYRLLGLVGQGQFAQVYSAIHRRTGKLVAIKKIRHAAAQADQEALILAQISRPNPTHINLVSAQAIFHSPTGYQFVLDYCESGTLRSHLNAAILSRLPTPLPLLETKSLIADILHGLSHLHHQSITHNDLKPENILLTLTASPAHPPLTAKIADFGHARRFRAFPLSLAEIGSPTYAAPERFSGHSSPASDLYAVGIMLYEMLLGDRPFSGDPDTLRQAHQTQPIPLPHPLTPAARHLLTTALHKQPHQRFASAEAMLSALHDLKAVYRTISPIRFETAVPTICVAQTLVPLPLTQSTEPVRQLVSRSQTSFSQEYLSTLPDKHSIPKDRPHPLLDILAIDSRHRLHIRTSLRSPKTYFECFTRKGRFIGMLSLNLLLTQISLTAQPYQLIALSQITDVATNTHSAGNRPSSTVVLIQLKPFQIKYLQLPIQPTQASALPWGYAIANHQQILLLDREATPIAQLQGLPSAITSSQSWKVATLSPDPQHKTTLVLAQTNANQKVSKRFTLDLKRLDLDFIF